jgi:hypothetical protein
MGILMEKLNPEMEIEGTDDMTWIDDKELQRVFFDLMNFDSKRFPKKKRVVFKVPRNMHNAMLKLEESGVFKADKSEMYRGLIGFGLIAMASQRGLCKRKVEAIILACKGSRVQSNIKKLDEALGYLDRNKNTEKMLENNIKKHGNNAYGIILNLFLGKSEIVKGGDCKIIVPLHIKKRCKGAIEEINGNDRFYIPKINGVENPRIDIKIPMPLAFIARILKESYDKPKMLSEIYRCAFTTGLEIVCNWVILGTIPEDEYNFCKIWHNIYDYLTDNCA